MPIPRRNWTPWAAETSLSSRIDGRQIRLYERIPGTDWYLVEEMSASAAFGTLNLVRNGAFLATGLCAALILAVLLYAYRQILRPITQLQASLGRVMEGRLDERIDVRRKDKFGRIQEAFNGMVEQISTLLESVKREEAGEASGRSWIFSRPRSTPTSLQYPQLTRFLLEMDKVQEAGEMVFYFSKLLQPDPLPLGGVHPPGGGAGHAEVLCGAPAPALSRYL